MKSLTITNSGRGLIYLRDLLQELVTRDMKLRYKRSVLGIAWSLLNPLAELLVLSLVFTFILPLNIDNFIPFLYIGLLVWNWFRSSLSTGTGIIVSNRGLIRLPGFPTAILPVVSTTSLFINLLLSLPILIALLLVSGIPITVYVLLLPIIMMVEFLLIISLEYFLAAIHVTFRDTQYLVGIFLMLGFYLSPVFYQTSSIPEQFQKLYYLNPMVTIIESYRDILLYGRFPNFQGLLIITLISLGLLWIGFTFFVRASHQFAEEL